MKKYLLLIFITLVVVFLGAENPKKMRAKGMLLSSELPFDHIWSRAITRLKDSGHSNKENQSFHEFTRIEMKTPMKEANGVFEINYNIDWDLEGIRHCSLVNVHRNGELLTEKEFKEFNINNTSEDDKHGINESFTSGDPLASENQKEVWIRNTSKSQLCGIWNCEIWEYVFTGDKELDCRGTVYIEPLSGYILYSQTFIKKRGFVSIKFENSETWILDLSDQLFQTDIHLYTHIRIGLIPVKFKMDLHRDLM